MKTLRKNRPIHWEPTLALHSGTPVLSHLDSHSRAPHHNARNQSPMTPISLRLTIKSISLYTCAMWAHYWAMGVWKITSWCTCVNTTYRPYIRLHSTCSRLLSILTPWVASLLFRDHRLLSLQRYYIVLSRRKSIVNEFLRRRVLEGGMSMDYVL